MEKNDKFPRLEMLGKCLTKSQNDLVLYDLLREKKLTQFYTLLKQGYSLDAFLLNCLIDNGFEDHVLKALCLCGRYDDDVYDFLKQYLGEEGAKAFLVTYDFERLIKAKFDCQDLVKYKQWDILLDRRDYGVLWQNGQGEMLFDAYRKTKDCRLRNFLLDLGHADFFVSLGDLDALVYNLNGCVKLFELKDWSRILSSDRDMQKELARKVLGEKCSVKDLYRYIVGHGGVEELYRHSYPRWWMLDSGITEPFVADKNWWYLYESGFYNLIDIEDWKCSLHRLVRCAVKQKKWDFLERKECLKALFFHFRWCRWGRCLAKRFFKTKK